MTDHAATDARTTAPEHVDTLDTAHFAGGRPDGRSVDVPRAESDTRTPLFPPDAVSDLQGRWDAVQASFVDEPRRAVEQADMLVAGAMKRLAETFADERAGLERQWDSGGQASTEDLRLAMRRYRSFFGRLLAI